MKWTLMMPVTRPATAWAALYAASLGQTSRPRAVCVCDNGPISVQSSMEFRFVVDALTHSGIPVHVRRVLPHPGWNLGRAIDFLLRSRVRGIIGMCDDDVLWEPSVAFALTHLLVKPWPFLPGCAFDFATTAQLTPNEEQNPAGWQAPGFPSEKFGDWADGTVRPVEWTTGACVFFDRAKYHGGLANWAEPTHCDVALCEDLGGFGLKLVRKGVRDWELAHPQGRTWRPAA